MNNHLLEVNNLLKKYFERMPDADRHRSTDNWGLMRNAIFAMNDKTYLFEETTENEKTVAYKGYIVKPKEGERIKPGELISIMGRTQAKMEDVWSFRGDTKYPAEIFHAIDKNGELEGVEGYYVDDKGKAKHKEAKDGKIVETEISYEEFEKKVTELLEELIPSKDMERSEDYE